MFRKKSYAILLSLVLLLTGIMVFPSFPTAAKEQIIPVKSSTVSGSGLPDMTSRFSYYYNPFGRYGSPMTSYLTLNDDETITRVEADQNSSSIRIEKYDKNEGKLLSAKSLDMKSPWEGDAEPPLENPIFGGIFTGDTYNYVFLGQSNPKEDDAREIIRIVRYDKDWNVRNQYNMYQNNTYIPFEAGALRCTEYSNMLYVHTCHQMYKSEDSLNHQANFRFTLNQETGEIPLSDQHYTISNEKTGYCSHSFNQFIAIQGQDIYTLDHGDAYPRGLQLAKYTGKAGGEMGLPDAYQTIVTFPGEIGDNDTCAAAGGLAVSNQKCLIPYNQGADKTAPRSIYLATVDTATVGTGTPQITTLDTPADGTTFGVPMMTQIGAEKYLIMWQVYQKNGTVMKEAHYCVIDAAGGTVVPVGKINAFLADCQLAVDDGGVVLWYTTGGTSGSLSAPTFYELDPYNGKLKTTKCYSKKQLDTPALTMVYKKARTIKGTGPKGSVIHLQFKGETFTKVCKNGTFSIKLPKRYAKSLRFGAKMTIWASKDGYDDSEKTVAMVTTTH